MKTSLNKIKNKIRRSYLRLTYNFDPGKRLIGIMMIRNENDILKETLTNLINFYDRILVLDGTEPEEESKKCRSILDGFKEIKLIIRDIETPGPFPIRDGARYYLLEKARELYGYNNWIGVIHGDEIYSRDPRPFLTRVNPFDTPILQIRLCHFFLHTEEKGNWPYLLELPVEQRVTHYMWPGTPEDRFFYDDGIVHYNPSRHSLVVPYDYNVKRKLLNHFIIKQYNYRSPDQMRDRAIQRVDSGWQRNHYQHIINEDLFFVNSLHVKGYKPCGYDNVREQNQKKWSKPYSIRESSIPYFKSHIIPVFIGSFEESTGKFVKNLLASQNNFFLMKQVSYFFNNDSGLMNLLYTYSSIKLKRFINNIRNIINKTYPANWERETENSFFNTLNNNPPPISYYEDELENFTHIISKNVFPLKMKKHAVENLTHFFIDPVAMRNDAKYWVEQIYYDMNWAYEILECFDNAYFIYVYRDPRDIIASIIPLWWGPDTIEEGVEYYKKRCTIYKKAKENIFKKNMQHRLIEICFEELISRNGAPLKSILATFNLPESHFSIDKKASHIGRWRNDFNEEEQQKISYLLREEISEQGYT